MIEKIKKIIDIYIYIYSKSRVSRLLNNFACFLKPANLKNYFLNFIKSNNFKTIFFTFLFIFFPIGLNSLLIRKKIKTSIFLALSLCFPIFVFKVKHLLIAIIFFVYIPHIMELCYWFIYKQPMSSSDLFSMYETSLKEVMGFIKDYVNFPVLMFLITVTGIFIIFFKYLKLQELNKNSKHFLLAQKFFFLLFIFFAIRGNYTIKDNKISIGFIFKTYKTFQNELEVIKIKSKRKINKFTDIKSLFGNEKQTFVVVIGESAQREHYQIYGYNRQTTPLLAKRNDIYAFSNVISPHTHTHPTLKKVLTFASFDDMSLLYTKGSMINYFKDAGFKTFWISRQENLSEYSTHTNVISGEADVYMGYRDVFKNAGSKSDTSSDYDITFSLEKVLKDTANKKVIFIHLAGSHAPYDWNIKKDYTKFSKLDSKNHNEKLLNFYDDTIYLNDLLLSSFIKQLEKQNDISYMVYFSDHGEDVRLAKDSCFCHTETHKNKPIMQKIPFITWLSPKYKSLRSDFVNSFYKKLGNQYNTQHVIHSVMSLSGLSNPDIEKSKSIFD